MVPAWLCGVRMGMGALRTAFQVPGLGNSRATGKRHRWETG